MAQPSHQVFVGSTKQIGSLNMSPLHPPGTLTPNIVNDSDLMVSQRFSAASTSQLLSVSSASNSVNGNNASDIEDNEADADDVFSLSQRMIQYLNPNITIDVKSEPISDDDTEEIID